MEKFHQRLFDAGRDENINQIVSPLSISSVLAMLLNGADGNTAEQIRKSFGLNETYVNAFIKNYEKISNQLQNTDDNDFTLNQANRSTFMWDMPPK